MRSIVSRFLVVLHLAAIGGCGEGIAPVQPPGLFVLESIDGHAMPWRPPVGFYDVIADSLFFEADGTGIELLTTRSDIDGQERTSAIRFTWTHEGARMELWSWCLIGGIVPCPAQPTYVGAIVGERWVVEQSWRFPASIVFRKVE